VEAFYVMLIAKLGAIGQGFLMIAEPANALALIIGVPLGIVIGAVPGLGPAMIIAIAVPLTYSLAPLTAMMLLLGIYVGGIYGGSITAILINTPGTPAAAATVLDGYPLAKQGKSGKALHMALKASIVGNVVSIMILTFSAFPLASLALRFGSPERFSLLLFALTIIGGVSGPSLSKGLAAASAGLLLATVGLDPISGAMRLTFDVDNLQGGIQLLPMLIGLFAVPEVITQAERALNHSVGRDKVSAVPPAQTPGDRILTWREFMPYTRSVLRSSLIGSFIGAMPGIGPAVSAFMAYGAAQRKSKERELFGKGSLEGVSAAEAGNNAVCGAALIPLLTLGIPGDPATAVLLGALMIHDLTPGPLLFQEQTVMVYAMFITLFLSCILLYFNGKAAIRFSRYLTYVPAFYLFPIVMVLCIIGAYAMQNSLFDVWLMLGSGLLGYIMRRFGFPAAPLLIAFLLGGMIENSLRQALLMSREGWMIFLTRPISAFFLGLTVVAVAAIAHRRRREHQAMKGSAA
jgi:putative tricarboxylic transport membrane protein